MLEQEKKELYCSLSALCVFRDILDTPPLQTLCAYLRADGDVAEQVKLFGAFVHSLAPYDFDFSAFLRRAVYGNENPYVTGMAQNRSVSPAVEENARAELRLFSKLTALHTEDLCASLRYDGYLPAFDNTPVNFEAEYEDRLHDIGRFGYGIFASAGMFRVEDGQILPIHAADPVTLDAFIGYADERKQVFDNTQALCDGRPAANMLLCGDAGTGKSSTVKACANYFFAQGVRLIELRKDQLFSLPAVMEKITENPLKFIVFIDDLSFNQNDDQFSMLKAALEGSASAKAKNAVIYATSNRRHIVKESFSDRESGDDVHRADTIQELMSLSDRFGQVVYFEKPNKALYLQIIRSLAARYGITMDPAELENKAEVFALSRGGRTPRAAEQFINSLI